VTENDILIFCFISMSDDSFDFKSFTVNIILNSLEKIFKSFTLINTEVTDMIFIDESLMSELCECFDIQSISLLKLKLIWSYDEISDQKSITHALYTLIMIQEHKNEMMSLLITRLDLLRAYQDWIELVSVFSSDLTQIWLSLYFLFPTSLCSTSSFFLHHILPVSQTHFLQA